MSTWPVGTIARATVRGVADEWWERADTARVRWANLIDPEPVGGDDRG